MTKLFPKYEQRQVESKHFYSFSAWFANYLYLGAKEGRFEVAKVFQYVAAHSSGLLYFQGTNDMPSALLPSNLRTSDGSRGDVLENCVSYMHFCRQFLLTSCIHYLILCNLLELSLAARDCCFST